MSSIYDSPSVRHSGGAGKFLMLTWACQLLRGPPVWFRAVLLGREGWKTNEEPPLSCREPLHERMTYLYYITVWSSLEHLSWYQRWNCKIRRASLQIPLWCIYSNLIAHQSQRNLRLDILQLDAWNSFFFLIQGGQPGTYARWQDFAENQRLVTFWFFLGSVDHEFGRCWAYLGSLDGWSEAAFVLFCVCVWFIWIYSLVSAKTFNR